MKIHTVNKQCEDNNYVHLTLVTVNSIVIVFVCNYSKCLQYKCIFI